MMIKLHNQINGIPADARGAVLAIGNFDGLHLGHRHVAGQARQIAADLKAPCAVMTFEPHPREFFQKNAEPFRLALLDVKTEILGEWGIDHLFAPCFDTAFAAMTADAFVNDVLVQALDVRHVVVGGDFRFGAGRAGSVETLYKAAADGLFGVTAAAPATCPVGKVYSSTRIRDHIRAGAFDAAAELLGRRWCLSAEVVPGDRRGRELGYPTANQNVSRYVRMPYGVYAVQVRIEGESLLRAGAANFGIRPMFKTTEPLLETHIFDFSSDIYGKKMQVYPVRHLRPEMSFDSLDDLICQMNRDCEAAKAVLKIPPDIIKP